MPYTGNAQPKSEYSGNQVPPNYRELSCTYVPAIPSAGSLA
jgi:hypothetical protein